jgi:transcriptional regulator with XRE-family HTH domain
MACWTTVESRDQGGRRRAVTAAQSRRELVDFLRSRRAQLTPADVGIPAAGRRRTPGLRREEVSQLSGVSLTWYTWLEQGRDINVSHQVLAAIARTLRLDRAETAHLAALAGHGASATAVQAQWEEPPESLERLLQAITPNPAYAISPRWDIVTWNRAYAALFLDIATLPASERNLLWLVFTNPSVRSLVVNWKREARRLLAQFRAEAGHLLADEAYKELVDRLMAASPEFREWWSLHDVAYFASSQREFDHPIIGRLVLDHHKLSLADYPELRIIVYTPTADARGQRTLDQMLDIISPEAQ